MFNQLQSREETYRALIGNGKSFTVPQFQRDYSWDIEEWEDLWNDILGINKIKNKIHYMGFIVLENVEPKNFKIIDGQQRLTTLSIIGISAIKLLEDWIEEDVDVKNNKDRIEEIKRSFVGSKSISSLTITSKLSLNKNNDDFYQSHLIKKIHKPKNLKAKKLSEQKLWKAYEYFYSELKKHFSQNKDGNKLSNLLDEILDSLFFTILEVNPELDPYEIFETLNARGLQLSTSDLLKNYLFRIVHQNYPAEIDHIERQWNNINTILGKLDLVTFLRHFWNSRYPLTRKPSLFKDIKKIIVSADDVIEFLKNLEDTAEIYAAINNPFNELWEDPKQKEYIQTLQIFDVSQCFPLLLSAYERFSSNDFKAVLKSSVILSFRYSIIGGLNPHDLEAAYSNAAIKIFNKEVTSHTDAFKILKSIYVSDENFENDFSTKELKNSQQLKYILLEIDKHENNSELKLDYNSVTLEHILPKKNPDEYWDKYFSLTEHENFKNRIGNFTLLESKLNKKASTKTFEEKIKIYQQSKIKLTNEITLYNSWNPESLINRQKQLAKKAALIWKI